MYSNELYHYGVKGMKWGHRKNVYDINASYYQKRADKLSARADRNRTMARMNENASKQRNAAKAANREARANETNNKPEKKKLTSNKKKEIAKAAGFVIAGGAAGLAMGELYASVIKDTSLVYVKGADTAARILGGFIGGMAVSNIYNAVENRKR